MTDHNEDIYLREMLDHAIEACQLVESRDRSLLDTDRVMSLAVVRLLEIVGEAASRVSSDRRQQLPDIPWSQIVGMRNILIHAYHSVDQIGRASCRERV